MERKEFLDLLKKQGAKVPKTRSAFDWPGLLAKLQDLEEPFTAKDVSEMAEGKDDFQIRMKINKWIEQGHFVKIRTERGRVAYLSAKQIPEEVLKGLK